MDSLIDMIFDGALGTIWDILWVPLSFAVIVGLGITSVLLSMSWIDSADVVVWKASGFGMRVRLEDSPLFMACLQKIQDGELHCLYVNPYMACFNFTGDDIDENCVMDFQKMGYAPINGVAIVPYLNQLSKAAKKMNNVQSVQKTTYDFHSKSFLIFQGKYGTAPGAPEMVLEVNYCSGSKPT